MIHCYFPVPPDLPIGYSLAVKSFVNTLEYSGLDYTSYYVYDCIDESNCPNSNSAENFCINRHSKTYNFLFSLFSNLPYSCYRYVDIQNRLIKSVQDNLYNGDQVYLDDFVLASLLLPRIDLLAKCYVRFHDDLYITFQMLKQVTSSSLSRALYCLESFKSKRIQAKVLNNCYKSASISLQDSKSLSPYCNKEIFVLDLNHMPFYPLSVTTNPSPFDLAILSNLDSRKINGIKWFIQYVWPILIGHDSRYTLYIGGKGSNVFSCPHQNIFGLGFVKDKFQFYSRFHFFVNPQIAATGVQLKTLETLFLGKMTFTTEEVANSFPNKLRQCLHYSSDPKRLAALLISATGEKFSSIDFREHQELMTKQRITFESIYSLSTSKNKLVEFLSMPCIK
jgi:hypothetical protein